MRGQSHWPGSGTWTRHLSEKKRISGMRNIMKYHHRMLNPGAGLAGSDLELTWDLDLSLTIIEKLNVKTRHQQKQKSNLYVPV